MVGPTLYRACVNIRGWLCIRGERKFIQQYKTLLWMQDDQLLAYVKHTCKCGNKLCIHAKYIYIQEDETNNEIVIHISIHTV